VNEIAHVFEVECRRVQEKPLDLALKPPPLVWRRIVSKDAQCGFGRSGLDENVLVQIPAEYAPEFREGRRWNGCQRRLSGYDVNT
jgi:hypothetical protein